MPQRRRIFSFAVLSVASLLIAPRAAAQGGVIVGTTTLQLINPLSCSGGVPPIDCADLTLYTWGQSIALSGTGWFPVENVTVYMRGPLNTLGVTPTDRVIGTVLTANDGSIPNEESVMIPFDGGVVGNQGSNLPSIPAPGNYEIHAVGAHASTIDPFLDRASGGTINLAPKPGVAGDCPFSPCWGLLRGGRNGLLGDDSPELVDPAWLSVWSKKPVAFYATVAFTDFQGGNQPAFVSHEEWPGTHYAHDLNLVLVPDQQYKWLIGVNNFTNPADPEAAAHSRIELEWETQNTGLPSSFDPVTNTVLQQYGTGPIGVPLWATSTEGDRVYVVGRWVMDNGHPALGDRTEIHPARLLATMRHLFTVVPLASSVTRASQVDIFVSGHGGGANQYYDGLDDLLDNHGLGGGRIGDYMSAGDYIFYEQPGPLNDSSLFTLLAQLFAGLNIGQIKAVAGPSAFATDPSTGLPYVWDHSTSPPATAWVVGPEERPVNDMDYDFDVPLPPPPAGATSPQVLVTTHPEHTTQVSEVITYTNPDPTTGLPTTAHVHLPYNGADSGIYARTLNFYWDMFSPPGEHFVVTIKDVNNTNPFDASPHTWNLWMDISGQWVYRHFDSTNGDKISGLGSLNFDVYLDPTDLLRVFAVGYEVHSIEFFFGLQPNFDNQTLFPAYKEGLNVVKDLKLNGGSNNGDIGGALFPQESDLGSPLVGPHTAYAQPVAGASQFNVDFTVKHVQNTTTTLTSSSNPSIYSSSVTFTATVTNTSSAAPPTGTLVITIDGAPVSPATSSSGSAMTATYSTTTLPAGSHTVVATYTNTDGNFAPSGPALLTQTVTQAPLTIRANDATRLVDAPNPPFSATYTGFVNGDTPASLTGTLTCTTTANQFSPVDNYPINCFGQTSTNYAITYVPGTLTITATAGSIVNLIGDILTAGCIDNAGIANALTSKLSAAQAATSAGNIQTAINILTALKNQISAQAGKHIATSCMIGAVGFNAATILLLDVQGLIDSLKVSTSPDPITGYIVNASGVGVTGATLSILDAGGNIVATATTDITGYYFFATTSVLIPGSSYTVAVTGLPPGFVSSTPAASAAFTWAGMGTMIGNFVLN